MRCVFVPLYPASRRFFFCMVEPPPMLPPAFLNSLRPFVQDFDSSSSGRGTFFLREVDHFFFFYDRLVREGITHEFQNQRPRVLVLGFSIHTLSPCLSLSLSLPAPHLSPRGTTEQAAGVYLFRAMSFFFRIRLIAATFVSAASKRPRVGKRVFFLARLFVVMTSGWLIALFLLHQRIAV